MQDTAQALALIADALGISIEALRTAQQLNHAIGLGLSENAELIRAFEQIENEADRRRVIKFVQGEAERLKGRARPPAGLQAMGIHRT